MTRRNPVLDDLHALRERMGRVHDFDAERIAERLREHERQRKLASRTDAPASQRRDRAVKTAKRTVAGRRRTKRAAIRG